MCGVCVHVCMYMCACMCVCVRGCMPFSTHSHVSPCINHPSWRGCSLQGSAHLRMYTFGPTYSGGGGGMGEE